MLDTNVDFAFLWQIDVACVTWRLMVHFLNSLRLHVLHKRLILHSLSIVSMFVLHMGYFGYECFEMRYLLA